MAKRPTLIRRQAALEKTVAKYRGKPFAWGTRDCLRMARSHLVAMGHRRLPKVPRYADAQGAVRALKATGHETLEALLDSLLPRIAPAAMLPGDIALLAGEAPFDSLVVSVGVKVLGYHQDAEGAEILSVREFKAAWRG